MDDKSFDARIFDGLDLQDVPILFDPISHLGDSIQVTEGDPIQVTEDEPTDPLDVIAPEFRV